jgi:hypothetical protein
MILNVISYSVYYLRLQLFAPLTASINCVSSVSRVNTSLTPVTSVMLRLMGSVIGSDKYDRSDSISFLGALALDQTKTIRYMYCAWSGPFETNLFDPVVLG